MTEFKIASTGRYPFGYLLFNISRSSKGMTWDSVAITSIKNRDSGEYLYGQHFNAGDVL